MRGTCEGSSFLLSSCNAPAPLQKSMQAVKTAPHVEFVGKEKGTTLTPRKQKPFYQAINSCYIVIGRFQTGASCLMPHKKPGLATDHQAFYPQS